MKTRNIIIIMAVVLAVLLSAGSALYYIDAAKSVEFRNIEITAVKNISLSGFSAEGTIELYNPSLIDLNFYGAELRFFYKKTGRLLGTGSIAPGVLDAKSTTRIGFLQGAEWANIFSNLLSAAQSSKVVIVIRAKVYVSRLKFPVELEKEYDITAYLQKYIGEKVNEWTGFLTGILG